MPSLSITWSDLKVFVITNMPHHNYAILLRKFTGVFIGADSILVIEVRYQNVNFIEKLTFQFCIDFLSGGLLAQNFFVFIWFKVYQFPLFLKSKMGVNYIFFLLLENSSVKQIHFCAFEFFLCIQGVPIKCIHINLKIRKYI